MKKTYYILFALLFFTNLLAQENLYLIDTLVGKGKVYLYSYKNYTSMKNTESSIISNFKLHQNYPNPFNPSTLIKYEIPQKTRGKKQEVRLVVYNTLGQKIVVLVNREQSAGSYEVTFNGEKLPSGVYLIKMNAGKYSNTIKALLIK